MKRYKFALKAFAEHYSGLFENEVQAFHALSNQQAVVSLGHFNHSENVKNYDNTEKEYYSQASQEHTLNRHVPELRVTHNILLEYGESDLDGYFCDFVAPILPSEIERFWVGLFAVAGAVKSIHCLVLPGRERATWAG